MELTREEVHRVALLAQLRLMPEELEQLTDQLQNILKYMDKLRELDTSEMEPFIHAVSVSNILREDIISNTPNTDGILANAPAKFKTFFRVPKIIE
jgi:aspartyl-tRNA(Asn)/glutamyl-tRNA(Gln) amidotransferase subunit C